MNLYIRQRFFSWGDKFAIYDQNGNPRYYVEGEVFSWGKRLHLYDLQGKELAYIQQKVFTFLPRYYIFRSGVQVAEVVKEFTFFHHEYSVGGFGWKVHGDFLSHDYEIAAGNRPIVTVRKEWFTLGDAYQLSIMPEIDEIAAVSVVLVIDACIEAARND